MYTCKMETPYTLRCDTVRQRHVGTDESRTHHVEKTVPSTKHERASLRAVMRAA